LFSSGGGGGGGEAVFGTIKLEPKESILLLSINIGSGGNGAYYNQSSNPFSNPNPALNGYPSTVSYSRTPGQIIQLVANGGIGGQSINLCNGGDGGGSSGGIGGTGLSQCNIIRNTTTSQTNTWKKAEVINYEAKQNSDDLYLTVGGGGGAFGNGGNGIWLNSTNSTISTISIELSSCSLRTQNCTPSIG
jgi:hypothetical protein